MDQRASMLLEKTAETKGHSPREYSPLALAYIGDGVYEIFVRTHVLSKGNAPVNKLHKAARELVKAEAQAKIYHIVETMLTEEELEVLKRGRNAKSISSPKNGDIRDYRHATGLEALIGYLYLDKQIERLNEIISYGINSLLNTKEVQHVK